MCGIICIISNHVPENRNIDDKLNVFKNGIIRRGPDYFNVVKYISNSNEYIIFGASVLWLQGNSVSAQPLESNGSLLIYNGDIFAGIPEHSRNDRGDTYLLFELLENAERIPDTLSKLQGPYAFIYLDKHNEMLYFGRDIYGRRSLLIGLNKITGELILTSIAKRTEAYKFIELPSIGTFAWHLKTSQIILYPWQFKNRNFDTKLQELRLFLDRDIFIDQVLVLEESKQFLVPCEEDLNIFNKLKNINIEVAFNIILNTPKWFAKIIKLKELLEEAVRLRVSLMPKHCKQCLQNSSDCNHSLVGVLFSGGIDCSLLALIADKFIDKRRPINLMNVAFDEANNYETPDRITGLKTLEELQKLCPQRRWQFHEVNVTQSELDEERKNNIADLIYPLNSILDDSLGCALWFASRGKTVETVSSCKVLLVGMGADELFGGYTKHRAAFMKNIWQGLHNILNEDWQNLSHRNLARDDRVVSDHGRQLRTPYLDENVVEFVRNLNCWEKTCPSDDLPQGFGDKILLRSLAYYMGLTSASVLKKRALQFGSRIANKKENANHVSTRLCVQNNEKINKCES